MILIEWFNKLDKNTIIMALMAILIVILIVLNYKQANQIYALQETMTNTQNSQQVATPVQVQQVQPVEQKADSHTLILYYTTWCGWSKKFLSTVWEPLEKIKGNFKNLEIQKIDCDEDKGTCSIQNIKGFPTVKLHKANGTIIDYPGDHSLKVLTDFLTENL
jgi:thioredoxin-like negative regulator of GroEL